jgi:phage shock protein A
VDVAGLGTFGTPVPGPAVPGPDYSTAGVPSLDYVRDKIEGRYAHSLGATELAEGIPEVRSFEEQAAKREEAARDKLEEIRRSLRGGSPS